jgi:hypothetical protein
MHNKITLLTLAAALALPFPAKHGALSLLMAPTTL